MRHAADRDVGRFDRWAQTYDQDALQERFFRPMQAQTLALVANLGLQRKVDTLSAQADADDVVAWPRAHRNLSDPTSSMAKPPQQLCATGLTPNWAGRGRARPGRTNRCQAGRPAVSRRSEPSLPPN